MASLEVSDGCRYRGYMMTPLARVADSNSDYIASENHQTHSSRNFKKQGQILGGVLPGDQSPFGRKTTLTGNNRIFIDLTRNSEHDSDVPGEETHEDSTSIVHGAQGYHRLPLADITHHTVSINLVILPTYEDSIVSFPSVSSFRVFEDLCEAQLWEARGRDSGTTLNVSTLHVSNFAGKFTSVDAIDSSQDPEDETSEQSSLSSESIQSSPLESFQDRSLTSYNITSSCNASSVTAVLHLADKSDQNSPGNKLECRERKRIIVSSIRRPPHVKKSMQIWLESINRLLDPFREDSDCWFHPAPPPPRITPIGTWRACGNIQKAFSWQDHNGKHSLVLNFGIVSKILFHTMTKRQKDGFVNRKWHLSHLCGNWTCLNPNHTTVEPGNVNISRNSCFSHRGGCSHEPKCMKEKKANLSAKGIPIYHDEEIMKGGDANSSSGEVQGWSIQSFDFDHNSFEHERLLKRSRSKTASKAKDKRIQDLYKSLGFYPVAGSELKNKINVSVKSFHISPLKFKSKEHPEAQKLAESFCADKETAQFLWPEVGAGNHRRLKWGNDEIKILKLLTHIFALKMHYSFKNLRRKEAPQNSLGSERDLDSDDELLITPGHQDLPTRTQHPKTGQECSKADAILNPIAESSAMRSSRRTIDGSKLRELNYVKRNSSHQEKCTAHIRYIKPIDDKKMMTEFISPHWLENEEFSWVAQGGLEPDKYILRFMHGFLYYNTDQNMSLMNFIRLFKDEPVISNKIHYETLKGRLQIRVGELADALLSERLLFRNGSSKKISRTQELDAAWVQRLDILDQPSEGASEDTESSNTQHRDVYYISVSPDRDERTTKCQQRSSIPKGPTELSRKRIFQSISLGDDVDGETNAAKRRRLSKYDQNQPPIIKDKEKGVDGGQSDSNEISQREIGIVQRYSSYQFGGNSQFLEEGLAHATATSTLTTTRNPKTDNSNLNLTGSISAPARVSGAIIESEPNPASNSRSGFLSTHSAFSDHLSAQLQPYSANGKPPPLLTTPLQPITQMAGEQASEDDLPLATFSNDKNFIFLSKQNFDYENPLKFNIKTLEDLSLSSFISLFAQRSGVNMHKVDGLKFTILLGDDRLETVMKGDERKWENIVEIIRDLWKYSKIQWVIGTKLKSRVCRILTERVHTRAL
ncbi:uncharacterized protein Bfra_007335 [Botrytis fragariae]|uniref:Zinc-binding loop region of homing endonuclease domain-containing protein n=1 Tax=Botrytis fragariae TaxID=1964551 RepID=A0A8H6EDD3_9HELO|nr:uncharacterized protein Bfra_007335 [Botrytis fragariae]KAF5868139.1 hypothetical protein Bfra_007335 [Botrytis fragariae]